MAFAVGDKIGHYEVLSLLGTGGMGEVYRARDTTLKRDVALKVLPATLLGDPDRMARFQREAEVLASLDHPNIGQIHGIVDSEDSRGLVLALIEGPTLADRIETGPIPLDEAVAISKQIIEALEYAHERNVVHRDLKPANIKITADAAVKVLDFGLAKVLEDEPPPSLMGNSPTLTLGHTRAGVILGTAAYMSPEQAVGRPVDRRSDIFSLGAVLYEMLSGKRAFTGATTPDVLEALVRNEPDWSKLPADTPGYVRKLLARMLVKDRKQRLQAIGEARIILEQGGTEVPQHPNARTKLLWPAVAAVAVLTAAGLAFVHFREQLEQPAVTRFRIEPPQRGAFSSLFVLSPDGRKLAFTATGPDGRDHLWVRALDSLEPLSVADLDSTSASPFWSPDGNYLGFQAQGKLKKVDASGRSTQTLCDWSRAARGGTWSRDGIIVFGTAGAALMQVPAGGGTPTPITRLDSARQDRSHGIPWFLPDGRHFLYLVASAREERNGIYVGSLDARPEQQSSTLLLPSQYQAWYAPFPEPLGGQLLFVRERTLMAQPFDANRLELSGQPQPIVEQVGRFEIGDYAFFSVSANGVLAYQGVDEGATRLQWFDRDGKMVAAAAPPGAYNTLTLSPDGARLVAERQDSRASDDLWMIEFARSTSTRLTFDPGRDLMPVWSPDGARVAYVSRRGGGDGLYRKLSNLTGNEELLWQSNSQKFLNDWSRDGRFLLFSQQDPKTGYDLWLLPLAGANGAPGKPEEFLHTEFGETQGQFSPDMRWVAYTSNESGRQEIYVRPFPRSETGGKTTVSTGGGSQPRWRKDGKELFYLTEQGVMVVDVTANPAFKSSAPKPAVRAQLANMLGGANVFLWDVAPDGERFLINMVGERSSAPVTVVLNWPAGLKK